MKSVSLPLDAAPTDLPLAAPQVSAVPDLRAYRLASLDVLRGLAIVVMALDHVRDFFHFGNVQDPLTDPHVSPALFFTRWITHYCAPTFVFLAGTSAGLMARRKPPAALGSFLLKRGAWLVLVECAVISTAFSFAPGGIAELGGHTLVLLQVIWAIGASMMVLAGAQFLGRVPCAVLGAAVILLHNALDPFFPPNRLLDTSAPLWTGLHAQMSHIAGPFQFAVGYPVLPWIGVMLLGFGAAGLFELGPEARSPRLLRIGIATTAAFVLVRALDVYGDPHGWHPQSDGALATVMSFLNTTKYPPSLQFLLMTLGPAAILCALADRMDGPVSRALVTFGRVPFAFYVVHFYLIHALSIVLGAWQGFGIRRMLTVFIFYPKGYGIGLGGVYVIWILVILVLYPFCRWVAAVKARRTDWWLSYV